jgi:peptidoglycan/xylan/chitin deacetylase (PgdA/CDA1 family)
VAEPWAIDFSSLIGGEGRPEAQGARLSDADCRAIEEQVLVPPAASWPSRKLQCLLAACYAHTPEWFRQGFSTVALTLLGGSHGRGASNCPRFLPDRTLRELARGRGGTGSRAVLVSHDVDYTACYRAVLDIGAAEARHGIRATYFFLTRASYRPERAVLRELRQMGHEIGLHGYTYDLRLAFRSPTSFRARMTQARHILEDLLGEAVAGYRNHGMLLFWPPMLEALAAMGFTYESCLYPTTALNAVNRWFCWPFRYRHRDLWAIPVTWPEDSDAFRVRGLGDDEALEYYQWTLSVITTLNGVACCSFHPSTVRAHYHFFTRFLESIRSSGLPNRTALQLIRQEREARSLAA